MKKLESLVWQVELEEKARSLHEDITKHVNMLSWYNDSLTPQGTLLSILFLFFYSFTYFSKNIMVLSVKIITQESSKWTTKCPCEINSKREKKKSWICHMSWRSNPNGATDVLIGLFSIVLQLDLRTWIGNLHAWSAYWITEIE